MGIHHKASKRKIKYAKKLRRKQTRAERAFAKIAKELEKDYGYRFWPQVVMFGWIVDFWCPKLKLIIEIDGPSHDKTKTYDNRRANVMSEELEATTIRFTNFELINNQALITEKLRSIIENRSRDVDA